MANVELSIDQTVLAEIHVANEVLRGSVVTDIGFFRAKKDELMVALRNHVMVLRAGRSSCSFGRHGMYSKAA